MDETHNEGNPNAQHKHNDQTTGINIMILAMKTVQFKIQIRTVGGSLKFWRMQHILDDSRMQTTATTTKTNR